MASNERVHAVDSAPRPLTTGPAAKTGKLKKVKEPETKNKGPPRRRRNLSSHPPYEVMIKDAITSLKVKTGSSQYAISKFNEEKYKQLPSNFKKLLLVHLKKLVASGKLVKVKGSFKLPPKLGPQTRNKPVATQPQPKAIANRKEEKKTKTPPKPNAIDKPKPKPIVASKSKAVAKSKLALSQSKSSGSLKTKAVGNTKTTEKSKLEMKPARAVRTSMKTSPRRKIPPPSPEKEAPARSVRLPARRARSTRVKKVDALNS